MLLRLSHLPLLLLWLALILCAGQNIASERHFMRAREMPDGSGAQNEELLLSVHANPAHGFALAAVGRSAVNRKDWEKAIELTSIGLRHSFTLETHKQLASAYLQSKRYPEAIEAFRKALTYLPHDPDSLYRLAKLYFDAGQYTEAADLSRKHPNTEGAPGAAMYYKEAADLSRKHLESHYPTPEIYYMLGISLQKTGRPRQAMHYIHRFTLLVRTPELPDNLYNYDWGRYLRPWGLQVREVEAGRLKPGAGSELD